MTTTFIDSGLIDGTDLQWSIKKGMPDWITVYAPDFDGHGVRDGMRVLGQFTYKPGSDSPCIADRNSSTCGHPTFTAALAWCGLPVRGILDDPCTIVAAFLMEHLAPARFTDLLTSHRDRLWLEGTICRNLVRTVLAVAAELETDNARPDVVLLNDIVASARNLLTNPNAEAWHQ